MKNIKQTFPNEKGLGLIEVIAALGLAVVVLTSLVSLSVFTLRSSNKGKFLLRSSKFANEEIELVRAYRDNNTWDDFITEIVLNSCSSSVCHMNIDGSYNLSIVSGAVTVDPNTPTELTYSFTVTDPVEETGDSAPSVVDSSDPVVRIDVMVTWDIGGNTEETHIYTDVSNWRSQ